MIKISPNLKKVSPYAIIFISSILLSLIFLGQKSFLNRDGIYYLETALRAQSWNIQEFLQYDKWPYFAYTLKLLSTISPLNIEHTACLLNATCLAALALLFVYLCKVLLQLQSKQLWIPALLFLASPIINELRVEILREPLGLFFCFLSLYYFDLYLEHRKNIHLLAWLASLLIAALYRLELLTFICAVPFYSSAKLIQTYKLRTALKRYPLLCLSPIIVLTLLGLSYIFIVQERFSEIRLGRITEYPLALKYIVMTWHDYVTALSTTILPVQANDYGSVFLTGGIGAIFLTKVMIALSIPLIFIVLFASPRKIPSTLAQSISLQAYMLGSLCIVLYPIIKNLFVPNRFLLTFSLIALIPTAKILADSLTNSSTRKKAFFAFLLFALMFSKLHIQNDKDRYTKNTLAFIEKNTPYCLASNNNQIAYYSQFQTHDSRFIPLIFEKNPQELKHYSALLEKIHTPILCPTTVIAIKLKHKRGINTLNQLLQAQPNHYFHDHKNNGFAVYYLDNTKDNQFFSNLKHHLLAYNHHSSHEQLLHK